MKRWIFLTAIALLAVACKKGELKPNEAPETKISVTEIDLTGEDRLSSEVTLHWSGTDIDGYVKGFEISFDNSTWTFVTDQDSTFNFSLSPGSDTVDIQFYVRAIDNQDLVDPTPAFLNIPIKNSPPEIRFDSTQAVNDTTYIVSTLAWHATDPDGDATLDSIYIRVNNGGWVYLEPTVALASLVPVDPTVVGPADCQIYANPTGDLLSSTISGLLLEGDNQVFIKAVDQAGATSELDSTKVFYTKRKTSDLLLVNSNSSTVSPTPNEVYFPIISTVYGNYDYINLVENTQENIPALWNPTFFFMMRLYDKVFWYGDETQLPNTDLVLEGASNILQEFLNAGGKLLFSAKFPNTLTYESPITGFSPMDSLSSSSGQARITTDSLVVAQPGFAAYPDLTPSGFITGADPFYTTDTTNVIYKAQVSAVSGWTGPRNVCARTATANGTNQIFFSVELHKLNGNPQALEDFFDLVLNTEFAW